jgi:hypothetical protein
MSDLQIKIVSNGWVITDRYGIQTVYTNSLEYIEAVALKTLSMEQSKNISLREIHE